MLFGQMQTSKVDRNHQVHSSFRSKYNDLYFVAAPLIGCFCSHAFHPSSQCVRGINAL